MNTSKRIAQAYVQVGQLSSAILEYETILQRYPDDSDVLAAMAEIESKANSLTGVAVTSETENVNRGTSTQTKKATGTAVLEVDDGRQPMHKLFVDGKVISAGDFQTSWPTPSLTEAPRGVVDPFIRVLSTRGLCPLDKSLKMISDKVRLGYLPLEKYDIDVELARTFPKEACRRWCVLPFDRMSKTVFVATANPFNKRAAEEIQSATQNRLLWYLASPAELQKILGKVFR